MMAKRRIPLAENGNYLVVDENGVAVGLCGQRDNSTFFGFAGSSNNTNSGMQSVVGGGDNNTSSGTYSAIGGGRRNVCSGVGAVIAGGENNTLESGATGAFIGAGDHNLVKHAYCCVPGGSGAATKADFSTVMSSAPFTDHGMPQYGSAQIGTYYFRGVLTPGSYSTGSAFGLNPVIEIGFRELMRFRGEAQISFDNGDFVILTFSGHAMSGQQMDGTFFREAAFDASPAVAASRGIGSDYGITLLGPIAGTDTCTWRLMVVPGANTSHEARIMARIDTLETKFAYISPPSNNSYAGAQVVSGTLAGASSASITIDGTVGCVPITDSSNPLRVAYSNDVGTAFAPRWYAVTIQGPCHVVATTDNMENPEGTIWDANMDTALVVFKGADPATAVYVGGNDDDNNSKPASPSGYLSTLQFNVPSGAAATYVIGVSAYNGNWVDVPINLHVATTPM
jgi:hypothetical protein